MRVETSTVYGPGHEALQQARTALKLLPVVLNGGAAVGLQAEGPWQVPGIAGPIVFGAPGVPAAPVASAGTVYAETTGGAKLQPVAGSRLRLVLQLEVVSVVDEDHADVLEGECEVLP